LTDVALPLPRHGAGSTLLRRARRRLPDVVAVGALLGLVGLSLLVVLAVAERRSLLSPPSHKAFPPWLAGPLSGLLPGMTSVHSTLKLGLALALGSLYACYVVVLLSARSVRAGWAIAAIACTQLLFTLCPPVSLTDVFNYLNYAQMGVRHELNPYLNVPFQARHDSAYKYSTWHHLHSPYGPLFTLGTYALAKLPLPVAYWLLKAATTAASLGVVALVWRFARRLGRDPVPAAMFVGLNPIVLFYGVGGVHTEAFVMLLLVAGALLVTRRREELGTAAVVAATAIKVSAVLALPVLVAAAARRGRALAGAAVAGALAGAAALAAFGPHLPAVADQSRLVSPLSFPNLTGLALGLGGSTPAVRTAMDVVLVAATVGATVLAARTRRVVVPLAIVMLAELATLGWVMPWYVWWLLPFAALAGRRLRAAAVVIGVYLLFAWMPLMPHVIHAVGLYPTRTPAGKVNHRFMERLLK
jgi:hypothetical protein